MPIFEQIRSRILSKLKARQIKDVNRAINALYIELIRRTSSGRYPQEIPEAIKTQSSEIRGKNVVGSLTISLEVAPMALAFEYGSGIWSERGARQKYPIVPNKASILAFDWPEAANIGSREGVADVVTPVTYNEQTFQFEGGRAFLPKVMHPGIRARPYIAPSIATKADEITEILGDGFMQVLDEELGPRVEIIR